MPADRAIEAMIPRAIAAVATRSGAYEESAPPFVGAICAPDFGRGKCEIEPDSVAWLTKLGLCDAGDFLRLPGEIIGGHVGRNVARVRLPSSTGERIAYLKREHAIPWRDRVKHKLDGYGFTSKSERELIVIRQLQEAGLSAPQWLAWGTDGQGRAFLLLEESRGCVPLARFLESESRPECRRQFAHKLGQLLASYHAAGFTQPDLLAKHVLVNPKTLESTVIDWQRSKKRKAFDARSACQALAQLHASMPESPANGRLGLQLLRSYRKALQTSDIAVPAFGPMAESLRRSSGKLGLTRGILQSRHSSDKSPEQKLHWLDGEAICAVPDVAERLQVERVRSLFYPATPQRETVTILANVEARILRESKRFQLPSPMVSERTKRDLVPMKVARLAFHLERHLLPAPRLLAFGIRSPGGNARESFVALAHREGKGIPFGIWWDSIRRHEELSLRWKLIREFAELLRQMHEAGCVVSQPGYFGEPFTPALEAGVWSIRISEIERLQYVRRVSERDAWQNLLRIHRAWRPEVGATDVLRFLRAYCGGKLSTFARKKLRREGCLSVGSTMR